MNLREYILLKGGTATLNCPKVAEIAQLSGCSAGTLYLISGGHKRPSWKLARRVVSATGGAVTERELRPDVFGQAPTAAREGEAA